MLAAPMGRFDWSTGLGTTLAGWRSASVTAGVQSVMMAGEHMMLRSCVDSWVSQLKVSWVVCVCVCERERESLHQQ